jgi:glutaredoxin
MTGPKDTGDPLVVVYWRPGCPFCRSLQRGLARTGLETVEVNIWDHPEAAAIVRANARGNETVPTVQIGETFLVNPDVREVLEVAAAAGLDIGESPDGGDRHWWSRRPSH